MQLALNPKTGQVGSQILLHIPEWLLAVLQGLVVMQQEVADQKKKKNVLVQIVSHWHQFIF